MSRVDLVQTNEKRAPASPLELLAIALTLFPFGNSVSSLPGSMPSAGFILTESAKLAYMMLAAWSRLLDAITTFELASPCSAIY